LKIPKGTFHRYISDQNGSIVLNQAVRDKFGTIESKFKVINSLDNKELFQCINSIEPKTKLFDIK